MKNSGLISWRAEITRFPILILQLGLLLLAFRQFQIESAAFLRIAALAFAGFAIHYFLPLRYRLPFFVALSLTGIAVVMGLISAAWLIGCGLVLITLCHVPFSFRIRVALLLLAGGVLATLRVEWLTAPWSGAIWPILGSMFMFRMIVYLYDLKHEKTQFSLPQAMSYFFMLPNVCFPMFPVVDYKTFRRNYFDADRHEIYQTGIRWMTRGVIHLILYRIVYYYLSIAPAEVNNPLKLAQLLITTFLLYLRISGQFHLIVGMLYLFGFRLPETHHLYYLASSLNDHWRRINIYWKDFMMKVFYYPLYFRLRGRGDTVAVVTSTVFVFFVTWLLHAYQWFWLRGSFLLSGPDIVFWSLLAIMMVLNALYEMKFGRARSLTAATWSFSGVAKQALQTLGTFSLICFLWSMWSSETFEEWFALREAISGAGALEVVLAVVGICSIVVGTALAVTAWKRYVGTPRKMPFSVRAMVNAAILAVLAIVGIQGFYVQLGPEVATFINTLRSGRLSRVDMAMLERGYYENLTRVERFNSQLWEVYMNRPASWMDVVGSGLEEFRNDFLQSELVPSFVAFTSHGRVRTNRWGMRDQEYDLAHPSNTYRIAMLGPSTVMGWGVGDDQTFETLLERRLNSNPPNHKLTSYEILNCGSPGYQPLQQLMVLDKALPFQPDAVLYVAHLREATRAVWYLSDVVSKGIPIPYDYLNDVLKRAGVPPNSPESIATRRLLPFEHEILAWTYRTIAQNCRANNVLPILALVPQLEKSGFEQGASNILKTARDAGFIVLDLSDVYQGQEVTAIRLADWDAHPNAKGHELIANRLYNLFVENGDSIFQVGLTATRSN